MERFENEPLFIPEIPLEDEENEQEEKPELISSELLEDNLDLIEKETGLDNLPI